MKLPDSDAHLEAVFDLVNKQADERNRLEVARAAALAAAFRAAQLAKTLKAALPPGRNKA